MALISSPLASYGFEGTATLSPGTWVKIEYRLWECWLAAEHVAQLGPLVEDLVEADPHEVAKHQLGDRAQARAGGADGRADERRLADRGVQHPARVLVVQALGHPEHAAPGVELATGPLPAGDVLAEQHHRGVAGHLLVEGLVDRLLERDRARHRRPPQYLT